MLDLKYSYHGHIHKLLIFFFSNDHFTLVSEKSTSFHEPQTTTKVCNIFFIAKINKRKKYKEISLTYSSQ